MVSMKKNEKFVSREVRMLKLKNIETVDINLNSSKMDSAKFCKYIQAIMNRY